MYGGENTFREMKAKEACTSYKKMIKSFMNDDNIKTKLGNTGRSKEHYEQSILG